jgi:hypothetical protein
VSSTDKTDHDITEILLKVALNTIFLTPYHQIAKNQIINTSLVVSIVVNPNYHAITTMTALAYPSGAPEFTPCS